MSKADSNAVIVVDDTGEPSGRMDRDEAHTAPGTRHLAFSVVLTDTQGRMLLQRRNPDKSTFGGWWANACCSHPNPGDSVLGAARRRVREELGVTLLDAREIGRFTYEATDPETGMVENELDVVVTGIMMGKLDPDPAEVAELRWFSRQELESADLPLAPWLDGVLRIVGWVA